MSETVNTQSCIDPRYSYLTDLTKISLEDIERVLYLLRKRDEYLNHYNTTNTSRNYVEPYYDAITMLNKQICELLQIKFLDNE